MSSKELSSILYAEDEADIREIAQVALEDLGNFKVIFCNNGFEVLEAAKGIIPDLILLDVMMPGMDGPSTLMELRKIPKYDNIPAIFMTAKIQTEEVEQYKSMGAVEVIAKPFDPMTLASDIQAIWDQI
ncbi:two-component response regulator [Legionella birminghamensis]|uniref:Two-component response regulator n=1 Tax=Legionella birminghamensis TaxID=28083 RepID=A0A378I9Q6_9GAMM|nr:response regulator [Legionella birminghamensis]KTC74712.1 two-component response regulator [Legionella birminghamensis]STX31515.1 two-component response regulator [Legionella birminghamensis]